MMVQPGLPPDPTAVGAGRGAAPSATQGEPATAPAGGMPVGGAPAGGMPASASADATPKVIPFPAPPGMRLGWHPTSISRIVVGGVVLGGIALLLRALGRAEAALTAHEGGGAAPSLTAPASSVAGQEGAPVTTSESLTALLGRLMTPVIINNPGSKPAIITSRQLLGTAEKSATASILTSNRSFAEWGTLLGDEVLATALLNRLLHHAEVITINGQSYRMKERHVDVPALLPTPPQTGKEVTGSVQPNPSRP